QMKKSLTAKCRSIPTSQGPDERPSFHRLEQYAFRDRSSSWRESIDGKNYAPTGDWLMKALVIGIDSASPFLIEKWIDKLPNIRSVFEAGAHGVLKSFVLSESVNDWKCFATGMKHYKLV